MKPKKPRGGKREGAGRKPNEEPTVAIRIPRWLANMIGRADVVARLRAEYEGADQSEQFIASGKWKTPPPEEVRLGPTVGSGGSQDKGNREERYMWSAEDLPKEKP